MQARPLLCGKAGGAPLPVEHLIGKVAETLPDSVTVTGVSISSDAERAYQVSLSKPRRASIYVDQYTGEVKGRNERAPFFLTMFRLHRWLMDSMKAGRWCVLGQDDCRGKHFDVRVRTYIGCRHLVAPHKKSSEKQPEDYCQ